MIAQPDREWFFKAESPYTSTFVQLTESVLEFSVERGERERERAADALGNMLPAFEYAGEMPLLMRYGFVNALNAALNLLQVC